jgi:hypothetical protein
MATALDLLRQGRNEDLWQMCCGFIDLKIDEFMAIQRRLLLEQLDLMKRCELGNKVMRGATPSSLEEFREQVPLTTYADYACYLQEKREDVLPEKPLLWQRTSGNSGESKHKWVPMTERLYNELGNLIFAYLIFCTCDRKGEVNFGEHQKIIYALAPPPYTTGTMGRLGERELPLDFLPPMDEAENMPFEERIQRGFQLALSEGLDVFFGIPSILVSVGERLNGSLSMKDIIGLLSKPGLALRMGRALLRAKMQRRPMLPKDLWSLKGIAVAGSDASIYKDKIKDMWGRYPLDLYGCTEAVPIAMQTWDYQDMTFVPYVCFLEFMPEEELRKLNLNPDYRPRTCLLDEVEAGEKYEIVISSFRGGPFLRYRIGDMLKITALRNYNLGIDLPQMRYESRVDGLIDLAGFTRLTEKTIWQAIENSGVAYQDWMARKEATDRPVLRVYIELKQNGTTDAARVAAAIHEQLVKLDSSYADLESMIGLRPVEVILLPHGAFQEYMARQRAAGADLAHLKPPHLNPSDGIVDALLACSPVR